MNFQLSEEQQMIRQAARDFAKNECFAGVIERDEHQRFPAEQVKKLAELGFMGMMVAPENGGGGLDTISYVLAMEEISKVDKWTGGGLHAQASPGTNTSSPCYQMITIKDGQFTRLYPPLNPTAADHSECICTNVFYLHWNLKKFGIGINDLQWHSSDAALSVAPTFKCNARIVKFAVESGHE